MSILVAGGGTGGHLFPGLAVAEELRHRGVEVVWLGARRGLETRRIPAAGFTFYAVDVHGAIGRSAAARGRAALLLPFAVARSVRILLRERARAVLAVGGYAALPGALAAAALGIPLILQEQNAIPGVTTRLAAPWSDGIACGFSEALGAFPSLPALWTGNPVRHAFFEVPPPPDAGTLLVLGGSQGSAFLNRAVPPALSDLERDVRIVHQAGERWVQEVRERYAALGIEADVVGFLDDPPAALSQASAVVARAGALTVCELAAARRAAVLIPFAAAAHGHQLANARALAATGAATVIEETDVTSRALARAVGALLADPAASARSGRGGMVLARRDAAETIAALLQARSGGIA